MMSIMISYLSHKHAMAKYLQYTYEQEHRNKNNFNILRSEHRKCNKCTQNIVNIHYTVCIVLIERNHKITNNCLCTCVRTKGLKHKYVLTILYSIKYICTYVHE